MELISLIEILNFFLNSFVSYHIIFGIAIFAFYKYFYEMVEFMDEYLRYIIFISLIFFSQTLINYIEANDSIDIHNLFYPIYYFVAYNFFILFLIVLIKEYKQTFSDVWTIIKLVYSYSIAPIIKFADKIFFKPNPKYTSNNPKTIIPTYQPVPKINQRVNTKPKITPKKAKKSAKCTFLNSFGVYTSTNQKLNINTDKSCGGGEATIHESEDGDYAKIFNNQVDMKHKKVVVEVLCKSKFSNSIVTPKEILYDDKQNFIGYTMPKQDGVELGKLLIGKITDYFPEYTLIETLDISLSVIKIFEETKAKKVVVGDVNPRNILVDNKDNVFLIDTDSFQLGKNLSLAYMEEYRRPRHRGKSIQSYLRKYSDDCFAVATIIFQILHFGLLPYGGSDEQSLNESTYIFNPYYPEKNLTTNQVLIKAHNRLSENLKLAFRDIFKNDKYVLISTLKEHILAYKNMLLEVQKNKGG